MPDRVPLPPRAATPHSVAAAASPATQPPARALAYTLAAGATMALVAATDRNSVQAMVLFTVVLIAFVFWQFRTQRRLEPARWLVNPVVTASIITFLMGYGISNLGYLQPESPLARAMAMRFESDRPYYWLSTGMIYAIVAVASMWAGYRLPAGRAIAEWLLTRLQLGRFLRRDPNLRWSVVPVMLGIAIGARLIQVRLGVFGYSADLSSLYEYASIRSYLDMAAGVSRLLLVASALCYYASPRPSAALRVLFLGTFAYEFLVSGVMSGFKVAVILPVLLVGAIQYYYRGRMNRGMVIFGVVALAIAYLVIEPFRLARYADPEFRGTDITYVARVLRATTGQESESGSNKLLTEHLPAFLSRSNASLEAGRSIEYAETNGLGPEAPDFKRNLLMAPVLAVVPRILWPGKPVENIGLWYATEVLGERSGLNSVAMSPVGYLYFAGGAVAIILGFLALGIVQRMSREAFGGGRAVGASLVFFGLLPLLTWFEAAFHTIFVATIQQLPQLVLAQFVLFAGAVTSTPTHDA